MAFTLPRLPPGGVDSPTLQVYWQQLVEAIESEIGGIEQAIAALAVAQEYMADIPAVTINADYTGAVSPSSQLPKLVQCIRLNGTTDETTASAWSAVARGGGVTCTIGAATGILSITAITASDVVDVTSTRDVNGVTVTLTKAVNIYLANGSAAISGDSGGGATGSGGTTSTDSTFSSFNSTTMAQVSDTLTVKAGSGGVVDLSAPLGVTTAGVLPSGTFAVKAIWQWDSTGGGVWVDLGTEVASSPSCKVSPAGDVTDGAINVAQSKTGLTPATDQNFRLMARNSSGTRFMDLYGTASAVGS